MVPGGASPSGETGAGSRFMIELGQWLGRLAVFNPARSQNRRSGKPSSAEEWQSLS